MDLFVKTRKDLFLFLGLDYFVTNLIFLLVDKAKISLFTFICFDYFDDWKSFAPSFLKKYSFCVNICTFAPLFLFSHFKTFFYGLSIHNGGFFNLLYFSSFSQFNQIFVCAEDDNHHHSSFAGFFIIQFLVSLHLPTFASAWFTRPTESDGLTRSVCVCAREQETDISN